VDHIAITSTKIFYKYIFTVPMIYIPPPRSKRNVLCTWHNRMSNHRATACYYGFTAREGTLQVCASVEKSIEFVGVRRLATVLTEKEVGWTARRERRNIPTTNPVLCSSILSFLCSMYNIIFRRPRSLLSAYPTRIYVLHLSIVHCTHNTDCAVRVFIVHAVVTSRTYAHNIIWYTACLYWSARPLQI